MFWERYEFTMYYLLLVPCGSLFWARKNRRVLSEAGLGTCGPLRNASLTESKEPSSTWSGGSQKKRTGQRTDLDLKRRFSKIREPVKEPILTWNCGSQKSENQSKNLSWTSNLKYKNIYVLKKTQKTNGYFILMFYKNQEYWVPYYWFVFFQKFRTMG